MPIRSRKLRHIAHTMPSLPIPGYEPPRTKSRYKVWSGSTTEEVRFVPLPKKTARVWYQKARAWNRRSRGRGRHGGGIGLTAMAVLHCFHFDFINHDTGRLDPSYEGIARMTGLARSTVAAALVRLRELGMIWRTRRSRPAYEDGVFRLRQKTNAYGLLPPSQWHGYVEPDDYPAPWPEAWGATPPLAPLIDQAAMTARSGASLGVLAALLDADPGDELAQSLADLARSMAGPSA